MGERELDFSKTCVINEVHFSFIGTATFSVSHPVKQ